jgi:hypothetical protein
VAADPLPIRIPAGLHDSRSSVQQCVIRHVLADHEVRIGVVPFVAVNVMHDCPARQATTKRQFRLDDVDSPPGNFLVSDGHLPSFTGTTAP